MKILLITPLYPTANNPGLGIFVQRIETLYQELGYEVDRISYDSGADLWEKRASLHRFFKTIRVKIKAGDYDLVNVQYPFLSPLALGGLKLKKPLVTTLHGTDAKPDRRFKRLLLPMTARLLRRSDLVVVNSDYYKRFVVNQYGLQDQSVRLCPAGGYDPGVFYPPPTRSRGEVRWLGFAGRLTEKKGWRLALEAYESLLDQVPFPLGIKLAGQGEGMADLKREAQRIRGAHPQAQIQVVGHLEDRALGDFYRSLDLFLFPTLYDESLGLVAIESLASGCPVAASDKGAIPDYLQSGQNGYLFEAGRGDALAEKILAFLSLPPDQEAAMRETAAASVTAYARDRIKVCLQELLESLVSQGH